MSDLQALLEAIDRLPPDELEQVQQHIEQQRQEIDQIRRSNEDVEERIAGIREALAEFREGLTERELNDIIEAMNSEFISPKVLHRYEWIDDFSTEG